MTAVIFRDIDDCKVIVARLVSGGLTIQRVADFLHSDYGTVYRLVHAIRREVEDGVKLHRGRKRACVRQSIVLPQKSGRRLPQDKLAEVRWYMERTNHTPSEIARLVGLKNRHAVYKLKDEMTRQAYDEAGNFRPCKCKGKRCPVHGVVELWPCVACEAEKELRRSKRGVG